MLNKKDLLIMSYLRQDARIKLTKVSRLTSLPVSTIFDRIKMQEGNLIKANICLLDFARLGFNVRPYIMLKSGSKERENLRSFLENHQNVNSMFKVNSGFDFITEVVFRSILELDKFVESIEEKFDIQSREVHYIINDIKKEAFMSDPNTVDMLEI